jgi:N-acetylated-alpha-linked acidic dipeptidase
VQRGSVQFLSICPGDPRTPECGGTLADHIPSIPVQPMGYGDAYPILKNFGGPAAPAEFQGGLNFSYTLGGSSNVVALTVSANFTVTPVWNVCGEIVGATNPQQFVLAGNHRDAWAFGAVDPNSGSSVLLEIARGLGQIAKEGYQPDRTIRLCSWDAGLDLVLSYD